MEIGVPAYLIRATLLGVMAQRLVRTLCPHCKQEGELDTAAWDALTLGAELERPVRVMEPVGCDECRHTGFRGRLGIYEMLPISPPLKSMIQADCDLRVLKQQAQKEGLEELRVAGAHKVAEGATTLEEVFKVAAPDTED